MAVVYPGQSGHNACLLYTSNRAFRELIRKLQRAGAETTIYYNGRIISLEFLDNWLNSMDEIKKEVENDIDREVYEC